MNDDIKNKLEAFLMTLGSSTLPDRDVAWQGIRLLFDKANVDNDWEFFITAFKRIKKIATPDNPPTT